jgi:electron transfer flavoprotein-quinone oxidoreductase
MEYALASGYWAAQAVLQAAAAKTFTAEVLSVYRRYLEESFVLQDLKNFQDTPEVLANPRLFGRYPDLISRILRDVYQVPAGPKSRLWSVLADHVSAGELWAVVKDALSMRKI